MKQIKVHKDIYKLIRRRVTSIPLFFEGELARVVKPMYEDKILVLTSKNHPCILHPGEWKPV